MNLFLRILSALFSLLPSVRRDDSLLDNLGGRNPKPVAELDHRFAAWVAEVDSAPVESLVDTGTAMAVIAAARGER